MHGIYLMSDQQLADMERLAAQRELAGVWTMVRNEVDRRKRLSWQRAKELAGQLPPGEYTMVIDRSRKVRNKPLRRLHMHIVEGPFAGKVLTQTMREDG